MKQTLIDIRSPYSYPPITNSHYIHGSITLIYQLDPFNIKFFYIVYMNMFSLNQQYHHSFNND